MATVIILNGVSSVGKTTLARAIQQEAERDFLHVAMDTFIGMLPDEREAGPLWFPAQTKEDEWGPLTRISNGPQGEKLLAVMRKTVASMAEEGFSLVVDEVCTASEILDYREQLSEHQVQVVKVIAEMGLVEQRERERGDRMLGLAREQAGHLHRAIQYDQVVDTSSRTPQECARQILQTIS